MLIKYEIHIAKDTICDCGPAFAKLKTHSQNCSIWGPLHQLVRVHYHALSQTEYGDVVQLDELACKAPYTDRILDHILLALEQELERNTGDQVCIPLWIPCSWDAEKIFKCFTEKLDANVSLHWPLSIGFNWKQRTWFEVQQSFVYEWLERSCMKSTGDIYHQLPLSVSNKAAASTLPTRLLDLTPDLFFSGKLGRKSLTESDLRLIQPPHGSTGYYMTLSHRWGAKHKMELTQGSLEAMQARIIFHKLPKTYQDAAVVARSLGFKYLWIDALCIIQNDKEDWLRESSNMSLVYHNSSCTIATHAALHDNHGFLGSMGRRSVRRSAISSFSDQVTNSDLSSRGWVFQERILSHRILHFTEKDIFAEDASGVRLISGGATSPTDYNPWRDNKYNLGESLTDRDAWYKLVEKFTKLSLTYKTDRLIAVEGLANFYKKLSGDGSYAWGLWGSTVHCGLLWTLSSVCSDRIDYTGVTHRPPPSWSWGSWLGIVRFPIHIASCTSKCILLDDDEERMLTGIDPVASTSNRVVLETAIVDINNAVAIRSDNPSGKDSFHEALDMSYRLQGVWLSWMSLDGEQAREVRYPKLSLALIAQNEDREAVILDEDEDEVREWICKSMYYFLVLIHEGGIGEHYRRVGIGGVRNGNKWQNVEKRKIHIL